MDIKNESSTKKLLRIILVAILLLVGTGLGINMLFFSPYQPMSVIYMVLVVAVWILCITGGKTMIGDYIQTRKKEKEAKK